MAKKKTITNETATSNASNNTLISVWSNDPGEGDSPDGGQLLQRSLPDLTATNLPTQITNPSKQPAVQLYNPGTAGFRYWSAASCLARGSQFWSSLLPGISWEVGNVLQVDLDNGEDFNAYYDRIGLKFFHGSVGSRVFYSGESPDVINHEQGHAVLDSIKPDLWDTAILEIAAFHESFADISAFLCALQNQEFRHLVLTQTGGTFSRASDLSRLAEQLGWAIRQSYPTAVETDCLRSAVNSFFYSDPNSLPTNAPSNQLSSEPHSFSRVFTGGFYDSIAAAFSTASTQDESALLKIGADLAKILITGIQNTEVVSAFYSQVAVNMLQQADTLFPGSVYSNALKSGFMKHGIISAVAPQMIAQSTVKSAVGTVLKKAIVAIATDRKKITRPANVEKLSLSVSEFGLGTDNIIVFAPSHKNQKAFNVTGAAPHFGQLDTPEQEYSAKTFVESLIRRGRLRPLNSPKNTRAKSIADNSHLKHHTHELRKEGSELVLRRLRIDCCFNCGH